MDKSHGDTVDALRFELIQLVRYDFWVRSSKDTYRFACRCILYNGRVIRRDWKFGRD